MPYLPVTEMRTEHLVWHHSQGWSVRYLMASWLHWTASITKRSAFVLTGLYTYSGYKFAFQNYQLWIYRMPHPPSLHSIQYGFWPRNSHHSKINVAIGPCPWNSLVLLCSSLFWSNWFDKTVEWLFKVSIIARWDQISPEGSIYSESVFNIWCCFSYSQDSCSWNQRVEMEVAPLTINPSQPLAKFLLSVPMTVLCWPSGLSFRVRLLLPGNTMTTLNWKLRLSPKCCGILMPEPTS